MKTFPVIRVIVGAGVIVVALAVGNLRSPQTAGHAIPVVRADSGADSGCTLATLNGPYGRLEARYSSHVRPWPSRSGPLGRSRASCF